MKAPLMLATLLGLALVAAPMMVATPAAAEPIHVCVNITAALDLAWLINVETALALISDMQLIDLIQFVYAYVVDLTQDVIAELLACGVDLPVDVPDVDPPALPL